VAVVGGTPAVANTALIQVFGLGGNDVITLNEAGGRAPPANLFGGSDDDTLTGGSGDDMLFGQGGNDTLRGMGGNDFLFGGTENDILIGGDGNDGIDGNQGEDIVFLGAGEDIFVWDPGGDGASPDLVHTLRESIAAFERRTGLSVTVDLPASLSLPPTVVHGLGRIAQEALANIARHAEARHVSLLLVAGRPTRLIVGGLQRRRDRLVAALRGLGYAVHAPEGAFYLLPRSPLADDVAFRELLAEHDVFVLPGTTCEMPGFFRVSLTAGDAMIERALQGFAAAMAGARPDGVPRMAASMPGLL
jgi:hypothetical protein